MSKPDDNRTQTKSKTNTKQNPVNKGVPLRHNKPQGSAKRPPSGGNASKKPAANSHTVQQASKRYAGTKPPAGNVTAKATVSQGAAGFLKAKADSLRTTFKTRNAEDASPQAGKHDALVPVTVIGALLGMLAGTLPPAVWVLVFGVSFPPLYLLPPLAIWLGIRVFKGHAGLHGAVVNTVFSIAGLYLTLLSCQAADHILRFKMSVFSLPLVTAAMIGRSDALPGPVFTAAYVFPAVFTVIGLVLARELHMRGTKKTK